KELQSFEQEQVDKASLRRITKDLIHKNVLRNNNNTVSAIASCCVADILRLFAPDPPYNKKELKIIFDVFIKQLGSLDKNNETNFIYQFYLLENLSAVKSILIMTELDDAESMTTELF
ncbi:hypothetical protein BJ944DRAFT_142578, partial [Cunninghamella echinulata]